MRSWKDYRKKLVNEIVGKHFVEVSVPALARTAVAFFTEACKDEPDEMLLEGAESTRYSVEVNYRTSLKDAEEAFAKICLGYVSAALKNNGYHVKLVFDEKPLRILVSSRNWDDGEWVGLVSFNPQHHSFVMSRGFYNRDRKTVSVNSSKVVDGTGANQIANKLKNMMHHLKGVPDKHLEKLKAVPLKRGPK
jgi:hypothetical protein